ncbi:ATP-binding protein [Micromonospora sp. WMMD1102]|uniref:MacS family sensor histidine kinase n=1 Tax=Micromonospora sp. WMMD1102 TaxID=3016105 RepID=UPI002414F728|nr:ATP-binding protein [Micromonospora sp. WMMD1102]MDG4788657.1 ATP-binding protein [Micromonospora sp. WMMD1102]
MMLRVNELIFRPRVPAGLGRRRLPALLAGLGGCLFLVVWTSPRYANGLPPFIDTPRHGEFHGIGWAFLVVPIAATVVGLCALRWWPYLLVVAGLLAVPDVLSASAGLTFPLAVSALAKAGYPLAVLGVLACAQSLVRDSPGWGAAVTGLSVGAQLFGSVLVGAGWLISNSGIPAWHAALVVVGFVGVLPVAWQHGRHGDDAATGLVDVADRSRRRVRLLLAGALVACLAIPLSLLTTERLADLLGVSFTALYIRSFVEVAIVGAITLVVTLGIAVVAGPWSVAAALVVATTRVAVVAPMILVVTALVFGGPLGWLSALAGVVLGAVAAGSRWRVPLASALTVVAAMALFIAYAATSGQPEKLAEQRSTIPASLILVVVAAAATAVVGATAPVLAPRGALPVMLGPVAAVLASGGLQTIEATYLRNGSPVGSYLNSVFHLNTSAGLLLMAGAAIGGLGFAQQIATRRAERKHAEQIRRDAATAERERLARSIHDGVLQVLALVQRHGSDLGGQGPQLATLAAEQETALRSLLTGATAPHPDGALDLRTVLAALASATVEIAAPAEPVLLPAPTAMELTAAVQAALDNVRRHAGPAARTWVLLEDEGDTVRVTVRDNGIGFTPERLAEAAGAGRLGVVQSIRGRITDLGGSTTIHSTPGEGTEVEFSVPRQRPAGR